MITLYRRVVVFYGIYTVGCDDLGAPFLTIGTRYPVGASSARPRIRLTIAQEANGLPYGGNIMQTVYQ